MTKTITEAMPQKTQFEEKLNEFREAKLNLDGIIKETDTVENFFLTVKYARQLWHGAAYSKLHKNDEKTAYRKRYELNQRTLLRYVDAFELMHKPKTAKIGGFLKDEFPELTPSHFQIVAPVSKIDHSKAVELLQKIKDENLKFDEVKEISTTTRQNLTLENRAKKIQANKNIPFEEAKKKAEADDRKDRLKKASKAQAKAYQKAKEVVDKYEKVGRITIPTGKMVTAEDAKQALSVLYRFASKAAHEDAGGNNKDMVSVNAAKIAITQFIDTWR